MGLLRATVTDDRGRRVDLITPRLLRDPADRTRWQDADAADLAMRIASISRPRDDKRADFPVTDVTWDDANSFCGMQGSVDGWVWRLPTEAQWELACGGTDGQSYDPPGNHPSEMMWYGSNSGVKANRVGEKKPNRRGIYDMHGNVREWCLDWWHSSRAAGMDAFAMKPSSWRVWRGGGFDSPVAWCKCDLRDGGPPSTAMFSLGFRMVIVQASARARDAVPKAEPPLPER